MSRPVFTSRILLMAIVPCLFASQATAGLIPWTYDAIFGYRSPAWGGAYAMGASPSYVAPTYTTGYAPDYMAGQTYTAGYAPYYTSGYAPLGFFGGYGGYNMATSYGPAAGCGCTPCPGNCSPCGNGCASGDCGVSNYAPSATDKPTPAATTPANDGKANSGTQTFRKKELPADEFEPVVPGSDFRSAPPAERDSTVVPRRDEWSGSRGSTDAPPATTPMTPIVPGVEPVLPGAGTDEVLPGNMSRPAPAEPRNDFFNETNEVVPSGTSETRHVPAAPQVVNTHFMPPRQRLQLRTSYALPAIARSSVPLESPTTTASVASK